MPTSPFTFGNTSLLPDTQPMPTSPFTFGNTSEIKTPVILKPESHLNNENNDYQPNSILNGKPYFPDLNNKNEKETRPFDKSNWLVNLWNNIIERNNSLLFTGFIILMMTLIYKISDLYLMYTPNNKNILSSYTLINIVGVPYLLMFFRTSFLYYIGSLILYIVNKIPGVDIPYSTETFLNIASLNNTLFLACVGLTLILYFFVKDYSVLGSIQIVTPVCILLIISMITGHYSKKNSNKKVLLNIFWYLSVMFTIFYGLYLLNVFSPNIMINNIVNSIMCSFIIIYSLKYGYDRYKNQDKSLESNHQEIPLTFSSISPNDMDKTQSTLSNNHKEIPLTFSSISPNGTNKPQSPLGFSNTSTMLMEELNNQLAQLGGLLKNKKTQKTEIEKSISALKELQKLLPEENKKTINNQLNTVIGNLENFKEYKTKK